jgi:hypothetical protein
MQKHFISTLLAIIASPEGQVQPLALIKSRDPERDAAPAPDRVLIRAFTVASKGAPVRVPAQGPNRRGRACEDLIRASLAGER